VNIITNVASKGGSGNNVLQNFVDATRVDDKGMTMHTLQKNKELYQEGMLNNSHEMMIVTPDKISLTDVGALAIQDVSLLDAVVAIENNYLSTLSSPTTAAPHIDCITGKLKKDDVIPGVLHVDDPKGPSIIIGLVMADSFAISKVYEDYDAYIAVKLSFIDYGVAGDAIPGIIVSPDGIVYVFIPAAKEGTSPRLWTVGVSTTLLNTHQFGAAKNVSFTPAVMSKIALKDSYSLKMMPSLISFTRKTSIKTLGSWIYSRAPCYTSILDKINTVLPTYMPSDSHRDVLHVWSKFCVRYSPWINGMLQLVEGNDPVTHPALVSLSLLLADSMPPTPAPISFAHFRNDPDAVVINEHTNESTRVFLAQAIRTVTNWMYYSGNSVFATVNPDDVPMIASRLLSIMNGFCKVLVFRIPNNSTVDAAYVTLPKIIDKMALPDVTPDCVERYRRNIDLSRRVASSMRSRTPMSRREYTLALMRNG